jgi:parallel beta-helix repeat protein
MVSTHLQISIMESIIGELEMLLIRKKMFYSFWISVFYILCSIVISSAKTLYVPKDHSTVQSAIESAQSGDMVEISSGEYRESIRFLSKKNITIHGVDRENSVINPAGFGRGISVLVSSNIKISNLTVKGGFITDSVDSYGAGIFVDGSSGVEISGNKIINNTGINGGGVALRNSTASLLNNLIQDNLATSSSQARGGGVFFYLSHGKISGNQILGNKTSVPAGDPSNMAPGGGMFIQLSDPEIANNVFSANQTNGLQHYGGGLYIYDSNNFNVHDNTFTNNKGLDGGGMAVIESNVTISNNQFQDNHGRWGGGLYGWHMSSSIYGNSFLGNSASDGGGGVLFDESPKAYFKINIVKYNTSVNWGGGLDIYKSACSIIANEISYNQSQQGGGVAITPDSNALFSNNSVVNNTATLNGGGMIVGDSSNVTIINNLIMQNHAREAGGGMVVFGNSSPAIINNTIFKNEAPQNWGGGIRIDTSTPIIMNNIIAGHSSSVGISSYEAISAVNSRVIHSYNDLWQNDVNYQGAAYEYGSGSISGNPKFVNADGGDMQLLSDSPCINAGNPDPAYNNSDGARNTIGFSGGPYAVTKGASQPLYRFFNNNAGGHFYTINEAEKDAVIKNYNWFRYEGIGFYAFPTEQQGTLPVYRFFNNNAGGHFYTINEAEKDAVIQNYNWFRYEGIGFYAFPTEQPGTLPVYRFFNNNAGGHFYTINEAEKDAVTQNYNWFGYEGIGFYAFPRK